MNWHLLILIQAFLVALAMVITRHLARDKKTVNAGLAISAGWFVVLYICGLAFLPHFGNVHVHNFIHFGWQFAVVGSAFAMTSILTYKMLVYLDAAVGSLLSTISTLFTIIGAALFLHEDLTAIQAVGSGLLLISITYGILATRSKPTKAVHRNLVKGGAYAIAAAVFFAIAAITEKWLLGRVSVGDYLAFGWGWEAFAAVAAVLLLQPKSLKILLQAPVAGWTVILGLLRAISGLCFVLAQIRSNNVALVTVISNFRLIIVVALGFWLLKERQKIAQKLIATAASTASLAVIFWK